MHYIKPAARNQTWTFSSDFGSFSIETPGTWKKINVQGIDSYVGRIAIDTKDTIEFNLGFYSNDLAENEPDDFDGDDYSKYAKTKVSWDTINRRYTKIVTPKKYGIGMCGIYIDSLWKDGDDTVKFNLFGENLVKTNQRIFSKQLRHYDFLKQNDTGIPSRRFAGRSTKIQLGTRSIDVPMHAKDIHRSQHTIAV